MAKILNESKTHVFIIIDQKPIFKLHVRFVIYPFSEQFSDKQDDFFNIKKKLVLNVLKC